MHKILWGILFLVLDSTSHEFNHTASIIVEKKNIVMHISGDKRNDRMIPSLHLIVNSCVLALTVANLWRQKASC